MENKIAAGTSCYFGFDLDRALKGISEIGIKYVELAAVGAGKPSLKPEEMSEGDIDVVLKKLKDYALIPISISAHTDLVKEEGVKILKKRIDFAKRIGVKIVNTGTGEAETEIDKNKFFRNIKDIANYAFSLGITVALETHGNITPTGKDCLVVMERINSKCIRINYDPANVIYYRGIRPEEDISNIIDYVSHVHVKDKIGGKGVWNFPAIGEGDINFVKLINILKKANYRGPFSFEIEFTKERPKTAGEVDEALKKSFKYFNKITENAEVGLET